MGENIRLARKKIGFSQEKLAEKADLDSTFISDVERGQENISVDALMRIAQSLKTSIITFFHGL